MDEQAIGNPDRMDKKPIILGSTVDKDQIFELLEQGLSEDEILANYPQIRREDILRLLGHER